MPVDVINIYLFFFEEGEGWLCVEEFLVIDVINFALTCIYYDFSN